ncbi:hypothetical protein BGZ54_002681 [Gamsiella multidivaricata]|nr:hypothetical protein BGZ54_002681 [Gamsiella multidivaricata]
MESHTKSPSPGTHSHTVSEQSNSKASGTSAHSEDALHPQGERETKSDSLYQSRGNLDTLAAAALKPLSDDTSDNHRYREFPHSSKSYQQQRHAHLQEHPSRPLQDLNSDREKETRTSEQHYGTRKHMDDTSRYHYREHGQQVSDDDSDDNQTNRHRQEQEGESPQYHSSRSPHRSYGPGQSAKRLNPRLKVNATQVYISYLIQLDQMVRVTPEFAPQLSSPHGLISLY